jgi:hypothetical protein
VPGVEVGAEVAEVRADELDVEDAVGFAAAGAVAAAVGCGRQDEIQSSGRANRCGLLTETRWPASSEAAR